MAYGNISAEHSTKYKEGDLASFALAAVKVYKGSLVCASSGYASHTPVASTPFLGVAAETVDNSGGSAGDNNIRVHTTGVFYFLCGSLTVANIGAEMFWDYGSSGAPNKMATSVATIGPKIGRLVATDSAGGWVRIDGYACVVNGAAS